MVAGCAAPPVPDATGAASGGALALPLRHSPANTQAVPVGNSTARGAFASGLKEAF